MRISKRATPGAANRISQVRAVLQQAGVEITDLTDSNPTRHGLTVPEIADAVARHAAAAQRYSPEARGSVAAREVLAEHFGGGADDYWLTSSTSQAYAWLITLLADPGERVAAPLPGYPLIEPIARFAAVQTTGYRLHYVNGHGWILDRDSLEAAFDGRGVVDTRLHDVDFGPCDEAAAFGVALDLPGVEPAQAPVRAVVIVDPGNPTGAYVGADRDVIAQACERHDAALIADEVFRPFALDSDADKAVTPEGDTPSTLATLTDLTTSATPTTAANRAPADVAFATGARADDLVPTFTLGGLSKLLCAPHLKLGWIRLTGPSSQLAGLRDALDAIADAFLPASAPIAAALPDLLALAPESVAATRRRLRDNLMTLRATFDGGPYRVRSTGGGWTAVLDVPAASPADDLVLSLLERHHLAVHPGYFYDMASDGALAISLLPETEHFAAAMARLRAALDVIHV